MVSRQHRLASSRDFQKAYSRGRQIKGSTGKLVVLDRHDTDSTRIGISVSTKVGNAVVRNTIKRRVRQLIREQLSKIGPGYDIVYVSWKYEPEYTRFSQEFHELIIRAFPGIRQNSNEKSMKTTPS